MEVKCLDTKEKMDRNKAYKVRVNGKNNYYSSKEGYERLKTNKKYKDKCIDLIRDIAGYKPKMKLPTLTYKKIEEYRDPVGLDVLYATLVSKRSDIEYAFRNKQFTSETAKIQYLFAIIQNSYMSKWREKVSRKRMAVNEQAVDDPNEEITIERRQAVKNIIAYLDDED